jgi:hypothetical protein
MRELSCSGEQIDNLVVVDRVLILSVLDIMN